LPFQYLFHSVYCRSVGLIFLKPLDLKISYIAMQWFKTDVLNLQQQLQLARWVARANPDWRQPQLLFPASRDGFFSTAFHQNCDWKGPTVVLARKTNGDLFGGCTDRTWDSKSGSSASVLSYFPLHLVPKHVHTYPIVLSRQKKTGIGILCCQYHGVTFGEVPRRSTCDMNIFRCGASTSARFCPGVAYNCGSGAAVSRKAVLSFSSHGQTE